MGQREKGGGRGGGGERERGRGEGKGEGGGGGGGGRENIDAWEVSKGQAVRDIILSVCFRDRSPRGSSTLSSKLVSLPFSLLALVSLPGGHLDLG